MVEHDRPLTKDTLLICVRCEKNKATHIECDEEGAHEEEVCDFCMTVEIPKLDVNVEWVNDVGATTRDKRIAVLAAKDLLKVRKYKWGTAKITGVIITFTELTVEQCKFDIDFRV